MLQIRWLIVTLLMIKVTMLDAFASEIQSNSGQIQLVPFQAKYQVTRNGSKIGHASISFRLSHSEAIFDYHSKVSRFFLTDERTERSVYQFQDARSLQIPIKSKSYEYIRTGTGPDDQLFIDFEQQTIQSDEGIDTFSNLLNDNQYFRLDIPFRLNQGISIPTEYDFLNYRGQPRTYLVEQQAKQTLDLPIGKVSAHYFVITRPNSTRRVTHAWFAPDYNHQLVRLTQYKNGKEQADMRLKSFTEDPLSQPTK